MLKFKPLKDTDLKIIQKYTENSNQRLCELSAGVLLMWNDYFKCEYAILNDTLIIKSNIKGKQAFFYPIGKDIENALNEIETYSVVHELPLRFTGIAKEFLDKLNKRYNGKITYSYERDRCDYIYLLDEIKEFKGKKFSGQRNHINVFKRENPNCKYKVTLKKDIPRIFEFLNEYKKQHKGMKPVEKYEFLNTQKFLQKLKTANFFSGYLEINGKIRAFSIGEYVGDTMVIHIEKALTEYRGIYPTMFNEFVKNNYREGIKYINRQDDSGDMGLRTSKLQYQPVYLLEKYDVEVERPFLTQNVKTLKGEKVKLSKIQKEDAENYFKLYTQIKNNKFWGYDYKRDFKEVDTNTFYNLQKNDYKNKNNLCLKISKISEKTLIGEVIIYNFNYKGEVEVGIRLFKKYQGLGYGKETIKLITDYLLENGYKVVSKCFKNNSISYKTFISNGYKVVGTNGKFYFFEKEKNKK